MGGDVTYFDRSDEYREMYADDAEDYEPTTWEPVDLGPYLRGEVEQPKPLLGIVRSDALRLIYPGREHAILGETESGKTWYALGCVAAELTAGNPVVYVHYEEGDPGSTIERLLLLGVDPAAITGLLRFVAPSKPAHIEWISALLSPAPSLVIHDGVNEAMSLIGADIMAADGAASFRRRLVAPFLRVGAATLACDHLPKEREGRSRDAYGSVHKGNALDGARIVLENTKPFGRGMRGISYVFVTKDRPGHLRAHGRPTNGPDFVVRFFAPKDDDEPAARKDPATALADTIHDVLWQLPNHTVASGGLLMAQVRKAGHQVRGTKFWSAVDDLIVDGRVTEVLGKRGARGFEAILSNSQESPTPPVPVTDSPTRSLIGGERGTAHGEDQFPVPGTGGNGWELVSEGGHSDTSDTLLLGDDQ
jgi:hypothetical protein